MYDTSFDVLMATDHTGCLDRTYMHQNLSSFGIIRLAMMGASPKFCL
jgi:hypothetical protein